MYFFYFDESGSRDPSIGTPEHPKDHLYVLLAVGMFEGQWPHFDRAITQLKLELIEKIRPTTSNRYELADCEVKSNWIRNPKERAEKSPFLHALDDADRERLVACYFNQLTACKAVVIAAVIDKRHLQDHVSHEILHKKAYELVLERIQHYMHQNHRKHNALIVMDDTSKELNRAITMKHALFQRVGNANMKFPRIVEYPFFTRSELSNGVQLADLLAYSVYRAFRNENFTYSYFEQLLPKFHRRQHDTQLNGLKVWPQGSPLIASAQQAWTAYQNKNASERET